jgi:hypothetical protein
MSFALSLALPAPTRAEQEFRAPESNYWMKLCEIDLEGRQACVALYWLNSPSQGGLLIKTHSAKPPRESSQWEQGRLTLPDRETRELLSASFLGVTSLAKLARKWTIGGFTTVTLDSPRYTADIYSGSTNFRIEFDNLIKKKCTHPSPELYCQYVNLMRRLAP